MSFFVAGVFILGLGLLFAWWLTQTTPKNIKIVFALLLSILFLIVAVLLVFGGKFIISIPALFGAYITYQRYRMLKRVWEQVNGSAGARQGQAASSRSGLSPDDAAAILGVDIDASVAEIKAAHKNLMKKFHPDQGGNSYQAQEINAAKEVMLNK